MAEFKYINMSEFVKVTREEFYEFVQSYPVVLQWDVTGVCEPPLGSYNDFNLGEWPESIVAKVKMYDGSDYHKGRTKEYFIKNISSGKTAEEIFIKHAGDEPGAWREYAIAAMKEYAEQEVRKHLEVAAENAKNKSVPFDRNLLNNEEWELDNDGNFFQIDKESITETKIELT